MKKLMIAAAIVCAAAVSEAALANWGVGASNIYDGKGASAAKVASGTAAYVFDANLTSQAVLFEAFASATAEKPFVITEQSGYAASVKLTAAGVMAGAQANAQFSYGDRSTGASGGSDVYQSFFFVLVDGDNMYLSSTLENQKAGGGDNAVTIGFGSQAPTTGASSKTLPTEGYVGPGQWAQAVPEPTSGLLLLLGVAGLALRRRRA